MAEDYLDRLAQFVTDTRLEDLEESTVAAAKTVVLDTIGAVLAGSRLPENSNLALMAQEMSSAGPSTLFGHQGKVQPAFAALVNATAGVALEMDEGNRLGGGHASIHVTPGAFAVAEQLGSSGKALMESIIVGYEVSSRIGSGTVTKAEVHSHGTWGTIGTAAAAARLSGFDAAETRQAMNLAVSMSPANTWTPCLEGATVRNLYPGRSGFQGVMAPQLVRCGFTGITDGPKDLYSTFLGEGFNPEAVVEGLGEPGNYRIQHNYFKLHACCLYNHPALDAVQAMARREKFLPSEVNRIKVEAPPIAMIMDDPQPQTMTGGQVLYSLRGGRGPAPRNHRHNCLLSRESAGRPDRSPSPTGRVGGGPPNESEAVRLPLLQSRGATGRRARVQRKRHCPPWGYTQPGFPRRVGGEVHFSGAGFLGRRGDT